jgi:hypothetical protein
LRLQLEPTAPGCDGESYLKRYRGIYEEEYLLAHAVGSGQTNDYVYVETNIKTPNGNSIAGFVRSSNGQLQPIPGSPFLTGGVGTQYAGVDVGPADSDQDIFSNPEHTLLFAVNSGSDTIAVFQIQGNGAP